MNDCEKILLSVSLSAIISVVIFTIAMTMPNDRTFGGARWQCIETDYYSNPICYDKCMTYLLPDVNSSIQYYMSISGRYNNTVYELARMCHDRCIQTLCTQEALVRNTTVTQDSFKDDGFQER